MFWVHELLLSLRIFFQVARSQHLELFRFNLRRGFPQYLVYPTYGAFIDTIHSSACLHVINTDMSKSLSVSDNSIYIYIYIYIADTSTVYIICNYILLGNLWYLFQCWNFGFQVRIKFCLLSYFEWRTVCLKRIASVILEKSKTQLAWPGFFTHYIDRPEKSTTS